MHVLYCNTSINDIHVQVCQDISDGSAAALIHTAQFSCLELYIFFCHHFAKFSNEFWICIIASAFSA